MKIKKYLFLFIIFSITPLEAQDVTPADEKIEDRMARIYQRFNQSEISDSEWSKIAGDKSSEVYTLQSGDTLWDISEKYFGTGFYWPKIWQLNDRITNPHMISVGNSLKFSSGSEVAPPSLDVDTQVQQTLSENNDDDSIDTENVAIPSEEKPDEIVMDKLTIPKGLRDREPLKQIPESFPEWRQNFGAFDEAGFAKDTVNKYGYLKVMETFLPVIASKDGWAGVGKISEMEADVSVAAVYQKVIIKLDAPAVAGDIFTVFANDNKIKDPRSREIVGNEVELKGLIVVQEPMQGESDLYSAMVTRTVGPISLGDELVKGDVLVRALYDINGTESNVSARILDGERTKRTNFLLHDVVYLDRGQKDGLQVGNILNILKNYSVRNEKSKLKYDSQVIGKLKVVDVGDNIATAVLVSTSDRILPGDETSAMPGTSPAAVSSDPEVTPESFE